MIWIEMSRDSDHGGEGWEFGQCIWSPIKKQGNSSSWLFWENLREVKTGDIIVHIRWDGDDSYFFGYSLAKTNGYKTSNRPPNPGQWGHNKEFYRVDLEGYLEFEEKKLLDDLFAYQRKDLIEYYEKLERPKNIFYVLQSEKLRCLEGAYLTKCSQELLNLFFEENLVADIDLLEKTVSVGEKQRIQKQRIGQHDFSKKVKANYSNMCCFPDCGIKDRQYLIGAHIARWTDNEEKRGYLSNGLCFCVLHDKAFETGYFSLNDNYEIIIGNPCRCTDSVIYDMISGYIGKSIIIKKGWIKPDIKALNEHRNRHRIIG